MRRYKSRETTKLSDTIPPPSFVRFEIEDTKTGRIGEGVGHTKQEARDNAWKDLKYGTEAPKTPSGGAVGGGGGRGASFSFPFPEAEGLGVGFILGFVFICMLIVGLCRGCDYLCNGIDMGIQRIYPRYETRQEQVKQWESEWQQTKDFFTGSERQLVVTKNKPVLPQARLVFLAEGKDKKKRVTRINLDGTGRAVAINIPVNQYNDVYGIKWTPTGKASGNSMSRVYHYRSSSVPSSNGEKLAYFESEITSFHWGSSMDGKGQIVLKDLATKTEKKISGAYFKSMGTMTPQAWSPDGNKLAVGVCARGGDQVIQIIDQGRRGKPYLLSAFGRNPSWSPDGNWIAFDYKGKIFIFEIGTVNPKTIKSRPRGAGPFTGGETPPIARGNIIRIGAGEKPLWEKGTYSFKATLDDIVPQSQRPFLYRPAIELPNQKCDLMYFCTEDNYNPDEWRVTPKTVSHTFDGGRTWHTVQDYSGTPYVIRGMETMDSRSEVEPLSPGQRDIYLIIDEP